MPQQLESSRPQAPFLWGAALLISIGAHVGLLRLNPNVLAGIGGLPAAPPARIRPDVEILPSEPQRIREELPRLLDRIQMEETEDLDSTVPELPEELTFRSPAEDPALPDVKTEVEQAELISDGPGEVPPSTWSPRQEVLAVTDARVRETLDVLPRTFRDTERTRPAAPDVTLPSERPEGIFSETARMPDSGLPALLPVGEGAGWPGGFGPAPAPVSIPNTLPQIPDVPLDPLPTNPSEPEMVATEDLLLLAVRVFRPEDEPDVQYVKLQLMRNGIESLPVLPRDVVFLVDCSASMTEEKLQLALEGVRSALETLEPSDRVQVIAFRDRVELFASEPRETTVFGKAQVRTFLSTLHARGQTDVFASLEALLGLSSEGTRPLLAFLITDGVPTQGLQDTREILEEFTRKNQGAASVFGLGGGDRVNRQLLDFLSFRNRGFSLISPVAEGLRQVVPLMASELRRPVLTDLKVSFTGAESAEVYPRRLSHLYVDRPWILIGRFPRSTERLAFQVIGQSLTDRHDILFPVDVGSAPAGSDQLRQEWAWQAGLEKWAEAISKGTPEAFQEAESFFREYRLDVPDAYRNGSD